MNYHYSLSNIPEGRSSRLVRGGSLKSHSGGSFIWHLAFFSPPLASCAALIISSKYWNLSGWHSLRVLTCEVRKYGTVQFLSHFEGNFLVQRPETGAI